MDERGKAMWDRVMGLLERKNGETEKKRKSRRLENVHRAPPSAECLGIRARRAKMANAKGHERGETFLKHTDCQGSLGNQPIPLSNMPRDRSVLLVRFLWENSDCIKNIGVRGDPTLRTT